MATVLGLYNAALLHVGDRNLSTATDAVASRYALDDAYVGAIDHCLAQGFWNFAMRVSEEAADTDTDTVGYQYGFTKPTDIVRVYGIYSDAYLQTPLQAYDDRFGKWYANQDPIYTQYVSNHATLGGGLLTAWPQLFTDYFGFFLARKICYRVAGPNPDLYDRLAAMEKRALIKAVGVDGMDEPVKYPPRGSWASSRSSTYNDKQPC